MTTHAGPDDPPTTQAPPRWVGGSALDLRALCKSFRTPSGEVPAVRGVDLRVDRGEVVAFLGPNGAGKTTTIDMILGLATPDSGSVEVLGTTPREAVAQGLVTAVMQTGGLLGDLTARETVELVASLHRRRRSVAECLERSGVDSFADRRVSACSGGQQQRVRFALALVSDPDLIVLDEPTTGMDVAARREFWAAMRRDSDRGRTVLFATHHLDEAEAFADRIVLLAEGVVVADGSIREVRALASGRRVRATIPDLDESLMRRVESLPGVTGCSRTAQVVEVTTVRSDDVARFLLAETSAGDLEVTARSLEEAFLALTGDGRTGVAQTVRSIPEGVR